MIIHTLVEGYMESLFLPVIFSQIGRSDLQLNIRNAGGGDKFWSIAKRFNKAGAYTSAIGLTDLEQARCAPSLLADRLPDKSPGFHLRLAVRMLESWLLADRQAMAQFLKVPIRLLPTDPDSEQHAKRLLVNVAARVKAGLFGMLWFLTTQAVWLELITWLRWATLSNSTGGHQLPVKKVPALIKPASAG